MAKKQMRLEKHPKYNGFFVNPENQVIYWRGTIKGRKYKKSTGKTKIGEARRWVDIFKMKMTSSNIKRDTRIKNGVINPYLSSLWEDLVEERAIKNSSNTIKTYEYSWKKKLKPYWGEKNVTDMNTRQVRSFEKWFLDNFPNERFFQIKKHLQMFINYLADEGYIEDKIKVTSLDTEIQERSKHETPFRIYTEAELTRLIERAVTPRAKVCLILYINTGLRKTEVMSLKWESVDFKKGELKVHSMKNKKWRRLPLQEDVLEALREWRQISKPKSTWVFPQAKNPEKHIIGQYFDKDWVKTKAAARIKGRARVHDIRHTFATMTAKDGWPLLIACEFLDMSPQIYKKTYVHITSNELYKWMKKSLK